MPDTYKINWRKRLNKPKIFTEKMGIKYLDLSGLFSAAWDAGMHIQEIKSLITDLKIPDTTITHLIVQDCYWYTPVPIPPSVSYIDFRNNEYDSGDLEIITRFQSILGTVKGLALNQKELLNHIPTGVSYLYLDLDKIFKIEEKSQTYFVGFDREKLPINKETQLEECKELLRAGLKHITKLGINLAASKSIHVLETFKVMPTTVTTLDFSRQEIIGSKITKSVSLKKLKTIFKELPKYQHIETIILDIRDIKGYSQGALVQLGKNLAHVKKFIVVDQNHKEVCQGPTLGNIHSKIATNSSFQFKLLLVLGAISSAALITGVIALTLAFFPPAGAGLVAAGVVGLGLAAHSFFKERKAQHKAIEPTNEVAPIKP